MWLYLPSSVLPRAEGGSTPEFTLPSAERLARSATWRTKSAQPRALLLAWKRNSWMTRLSGLTSNPLTVAIGAAVWMESLEGIRASRFPWRAAAEGWTIHGISGPSSQTSSGQLSLDGASSRTSPVICDWDSEKSQKSFEAWATALRRHSSERRKSARLTEESGSSSSLWTTPQAHDQSGGNPERVGRYGTKHGGRNLADDVTQWATPTSRDWKDEGPNVDWVKVAAKKKLAGEAMLWPTPMASDDGRKVTTASLQDGLIKRQAEWAGHQGYLETGAVSLNSYGRPRLNPHFVAWLMGAYWRALIGYESSGMG